MPRPNFVRCLAPLALALAFGAPCAEAQSPDPQDLPPYTVGFMLRGYFIAGSLVPDREALGGFAPSSHYPHPLDRDDVPPNAVSLVARTDELLRWGDRRGFRVLLANTTGEQVAFDASDSRLRIVREALDTDGSWKPIEYLPSSWCGNSYHRVFLRPGEYWSFVAPEYGGTQATTMRFALRGRDGSVLYSNAFPGHIDPRQFSVKEGHTATNIMDPYDE